MGRKPKRARVNLPMERRKERPIVEIHVKEPCILIVTQHKRTDRVDAPPGTRLHRPKSGA